MPGSLKVPLDELRLLIADRYTAAEIVERLDLTAEELLDYCMDEVYDNIKDFWELHRDLGITDNGNDTEAEETD